MALCRISGLADAPLAAAADFYALAMPDVLSALERVDDHLLLVFPAASHDHDAWRLAAVQSLAREHAPVRVNAAAGDDAAALAAVEGWLDRVPGVTGQVFQLDGTGAGLMV